MQKVSCIIPAYNEGDRIQGVLSAVYNHPYVSELIVIDDGSSDQTKDVVGRFFVDEWLLCEHRRSICL